MYNLQSKIETNNLNKVEKSEKDWLRRKIKGKRGFSQRYWDLIENK